MIVLGCIFAAGVIATFYLYKDDGIYRTRSPKNVSETICLNICRHYRSVISTRIQNGSIMSLYTNDTDTLRQMISQAIPQALMSFFHDHCNILFISMLVLSPIFNDSCSLFVIGIMITVTKSDLVETAEKYFIRQQKIISRCDRIYRRENEWTESCQSL